MLMPKRVKRRKQFRGTMKGKALRGNKISYGEFGIVAMEPCWIRSNQIEAARVAMTRYIKRGGKVWIKIFPDKFIRHMLMYCISALFVSCNRLIKCRIIIIPLQNERISKNQKCNH